MSDLVGSVRTLLRYPVKSMAGEAIPAAQLLADHGVQGDRAFAVLDVETGRIASAKHPRRWSGLLECSARFVDPLAADQRRGPVALALPGGVHLRSDHDDLDHALSAALGRTVCLVDTPPPQAVYDGQRAGRDEASGEPLAVGADVGTFFDFAPIHLVTTASLDRLGELCPTSDFAVQRFRPNLVIDTGDRQGFVENEWIGRTITIGAVALYVSFPCPRCVMTTLAQGALPADPAVLLAATRHNRQMFALLARTMPTVGVYATVVRPGVVHPGDPVHLAGRAPLRRAAAFMHAIKRAIRR